MSLQSLLSIARSALAVHQRAMAVTGNNVANAQTPGYSRQRLAIVPSDPLRTTDGLIGRGVEDRGVVRMRDLFRDGTFWRQSGLLGSSSTLRDMLSQVETALNEPSDSGVNAAIDGLFSSFADLANDPSNGTRREVVRSAATQFISRLQQLSSEVGQAASDAQSRLEAQVDQANTMLARIGSLNAEIAASGGQYHSAPDLQDQRDLLVDQLSGMMNVRVIPHDDGTISVLTHGAALVDGPSVQAMQVVGVPGGGATVGVGGVALDTGTGSLGALSDLVTTTIPSIRSQLDNLALSMVTQVNNLHRTGYTLNGTTNVSFFDPSGVTANTIALSSDVRATADNIAAGGQPLPGDGSTALALAGLSSTQIATLGGKTLRDFYSTFAGSFGLEVQRATDDANAHQTMVDNADAVRSSVSGVSVDEEMANLIVEQQAYGAAARLLKVADDMMQTLLNSF